MKVWVKKNVAAVFYWGKWMNACLGKSCLFGLLCMSFVNVYEFLWVSFFPFWILGLDVGLDGINSLSLPFYLLWYQ